MAIILLFLVGAQADHTGRSGMRPAHQNASIIYSRAQVFRMMTPPGRPQRNIDTAGQRIAIHIGTSEAAP